MREGHSTNMTAMECKYDCDGMQAACSEQTQVSIDFTRQNSRMTDSSHRGAYVAGNTTNNGFIAQQRHGYHPPDFLVIARGISRRAPSGWSFPRSYGV
jgi:hypothetical protein